MIRAGPDRAGHVPVLMLGALTATMPVGLNTFMPSMPGAAADLGVSYASVQLTVSAYLVTVAIGQLLYGPAADRFGRRPTLLFALALVTLAPLVCASASSVEMLVAGRMLQAAGACGALVCARAILRDLYRRERVASLLASITMVVALVSASAPWLGGTLEQHWSWRGGFLVLAVLGLVLLTVAARTVPETNRWAGGGGSLWSSFRAARTLLRSRAYVAYVLHTACTQSAWFGFVASFPYIVTELLGRPSTDYGRYFPVMIVGYILGNFATSRLAERTGVDRLIVVGSVLGCVAAAAFGLCTLTPELSMLGIVLPIAAMVFSQGLSQQCAMAGAISIYPEFAGRAAGLMGFVQMLCAAATAQVVGALLVDSMLPVASAVMGFVAMSLVFAIVAARAIKPHTDD